MINFAIFLCVAIGIWQAIIQSQSWTAWPLLAAVLVIAKFKIKRK